MRIARPKRWWRICTKLGNSTSYDYMSERKETMIAALKQAANLFMGDSMLPYRITIRGSDTLPKV